jgi:hypothetical protein
MTFLNKNGLDTLSNPMSKRKGGPCAGLMQGVVEVERELTALLLLLPASLSLVYCYAS